MSHQQKPPVESLSEVEWTAMSANAQTVVIGLVEENRQLKLMVAKLQEQLRRNSRNSSQPPSQDKPEQKPIEAEKASQPRQRGGQVGHVGRGRALVPVEAVDRLVVHRPEQCRVCGALLLGYDTAPQRHPITELPPLKATVTEHQVHTLICGCCGATNRCELPAAVAASQFGPNLVSLLAVLMGCYRLSKRQTADLLTTCLGIRLAASSVVNQQRVISEALAHPVEELQAYVQQQPACNVDETSWRMEKTPDKDRESMSIAAFTRSGPSKTKRRNWTSDASHLFEKLPGAREASLQYSLCGL